MGDLDGHGYRKSCGGEDRGWKQWWSLNQSHTFFFFFLFLFLSLSFSLPPYASLPSKSARQSSLATPSRSGLATTTPRSNHWLDLFPLPPPTLHSQLLWKKPTPIPTIQPNLKPKPIFSQTRKIIPFNRSSTPNQTISNQKQVTSERERDLRKRREFRFGWERERERLFSFFFY